MVDTLLWISIEIHFFNRISNAMFPPSQVRCLFFLANQMVGGYFYILLWFYVPAQRIWTERSYVGNSAAKQRAITGNI
jgi:hypothetical protein